jgi:polyhydroxyalkanoate synthesis repressor PhaR
MMKFDMAQKTILIKKYENRRLYDATNSRYVNLEEVAQMLQNGDDVRVVDATSGEDITRLILTQIIVEDAKAPDSKFPLDILRQMVVASGRASQETALRYMKAMLDIYQNSYRAMSPAINPFEFIQNPGAAARGATVDSPPVEVPEAAPPATSKPAKKSEAEDVDGLKQRLAELEKVVSSLAPKKSARKKTAREK